MFLVLILPSIASHSTERPKWNLLLLPLPLFSSSVSPRWPNDSSWLFACVRERACGWDPRLKRSMFLIDLAALIESGYYFSNPFHNSVHAADVVQAMYCTLQEPGVICCNLCVVFFQIYWRRIQCWYQVFTLLFCSWQRNFRFSHWRLNNPDLQFVWCTDSNALAIRLRYYTAILISIQFLCWWIC